MEPIRIAASGNAVIPGRINKIHSVVLVGGSADATLSLFDAATQTGTARLTMAVKAGDTRQIKFGGAFKTGVSATLAGTGAVAYLMLD